MKKIIAFLLACCMLLCSNVFAADFSMVDIYLDSNNILALTEDGTVFKTKSLDSATKEIVMSDVASFTNKSDIYLMKNGDISYKGKEIRGLDVKQIIGIDMCRDDDVFYINNNNELIIYTVNDDRKRKITDNFKDIRYVENNGGGIYQNIAFVINNNNELYCWYVSGNSYNVDFENSNLQYVASEVVDFEVTYSNGYYLKSNGEFYKYNFNLLQSELIMGNVDIWQGIEISHDNILIYANGQFYLNGQYSNNGTSVTFKESNTLIPYECKHGVNDMATYNHGIYYIGKDNKLYVYNLYDWYAPDKKSLNIIANDINFKQLFTPGGVSSEGIYALDSNNNLYCISEASVTENACLGGKIANAVPKKFCYYNGTLFLTEAGECYGVKWGKREILQTCFNYKDVNVIINEKPIELKAPIQMKDGRSMYPLRECFNAMGASVIWDGTNNIAIGEIPGTKIEFPIGKNEYYINGIRYGMDVAAYVDNSINRTYIPIRYAAEGLGFTVDWTEGELENTISIHK